MGAASGIVLVHLAQASADVARVLPPLDVRLDHDLSFDMIVAEVRELLVHPLAEARCLPRTFDPEHVHQDLLGNPSERCLPADADVIYPGLVLVMRHAS